MHLKTRNGIGFHFMKPCEKQVFLPSFFASASARHYNGTCIEENLTFIDKNRFNLLS